jgi:hypothetical protein
MGGGVDWNPPACNRPHSKDETKGAPWFLFSFLFTVEGTSQQRPNKGCTLIIFFSVFFTIEGTSQQRLDKGCTLFFFLFFFLFFLLLREPHSKDQTKGAPWFYFIFCFYCWGDLTTKTRQRVHLVFFSVFFTVKGTSQQRPNKGCTLILFYFLFLPLRGPHNKD